MYPGRVAGSVEKIHIAAVESELPTAVGAVDVTADGVVGDRYSQSRDLTLIEVEALDDLLAETGIEVSPAESRRQVLTRGIRLNDLVIQNVVVVPVLWRMVVSAVGNRLKGTDVSGWDSNFWRVAYWYREG